MKSFGVLLIALLAGSAMADDCSYQEAKGVEFVFSEKPKDLQSYGYQMWGRTPERAKNLPYKEFVGRRGKFLGTITRSSSFANYHDVLLDDCERLFLHFTGQDEELDRSFVGRRGVTIVSGAFLTQWKAATRVDPMTDDISCTVTADSRMPFPMFHFNKGGLSSIGIVGGDFPGKDITLRVDKNTAVGGEEQISGPKAQALVAQIRSGGTTLLTKSYEWPRESSELREFTLTGIAEAIDECLAAVK